MNVPPMMARERKRRRKRRKTRRKRRTRRTRRRRARRSASVAGLPRTSRYHLVSTYVLYRLLGCAICLPAVSTELILPQASGGLTSSSRVSWRSLIICMLFSPLFCKPSIFFFAHCEALGLTFASECDSELAHHLHPEFLVDNADASCASFAVLACLPTDGSKQLRLCCSA
jgi:hypothetical protein